ncbi:MAG: phosphotransferase [Chloroflexi bacterium]|nr:phosphotransferase [Chloroflexota bacterium]
MTRATQPSSRRSRDSPDLEAVADAITGAVPEAEPVRPLQVLGEGFFSLAVCTRSGRVFRLAKSPDVMRRHHLELRLLPWLRSRGLPVAVPYPEWRLSASEAFPFGHRLLPGAPLTSAGLVGSDHSIVAADLARFLLALHRITPLEVAALDLPGPERPLRAMASLRDNALAGLRRVLPSREFDVVEHWWDRYLADERMERHSPVLVHGDIGGENLLVDGAPLRLVGVLDFEDAAIGDPAIDFCRLGYLGEPFLEDVLSAYVSLGGVVDAGFRYRLARHWELRPFYGAQRAVLRDDHASLDRAVARLRVHGVLPA